ncbi:hypothetical protein [Brucella pseudogrignonensis]|uniref:Uncharacterized protein n=1 Tax=Brucella pseudogrignonensis TaxID=419475 RepID=A0ABU1MEZ4_9HYPH|nr:hypothetical protein [Brucella pseudogrignonensis]MDR6434624.1 hypothetical protein [Brucella pseudogrignonensis]
MKAMSEHSVTSGMRQTIEKIREKVGREGLTSQDEARLLDTLRILNIKEYSPEMTEILIRTILVDGPLRTLLIDVLDGLKTLNLNVHNIDVKDDQLARKLADLSAAVTHLNESNSNHDAMVADIKEKLESVVDQIFNDLQKQMMAAASQKFLDKDDASSILRKGFADLRYAQKDHFDKFDQHQRDMYNKQDALNEKVVTNSEGWVYGAIVFGVGFVFGIAACFGFFVR